jgi:hypothetical protein
MRLKMIRAELPRVSYCEVQEYAKVEVDFTGCEELNTSELKRRATAHFVRDVVGVSCMEQALEEWSGKCHLEAYRGLSQRQK